MFLGGGQVSSQITEPAHCNRLLDIILLEFGPLQILRYTLFTVQGFGQSIPYSLGACSKLNNLAFVQYQYYEPGLLALCSAELLIPTNNV